LIVEEALEGEVSDATSLAASVMSAAMGRRPATAMVIGRAR
jgi:hypothetical protein